VELSAAVAEAVAWLHEVDAVFSPFRGDSVVSRLRTGECEPGTCAADVLEVLGRCEAARSLTHGAFDPWAVPGGFDPSGLVKGWAAERAADLLVSRGFGNVMIDAGGDVVCRGSAAPGEQWRIGIRHPDDARSVIGTVLIDDGAVATSGDYERGEHVVDPGNSGPARGGRAATVVGPDAGLADALATGAVVAGVAAFAWLHDLPDYSLHLTVGDRVISAGRAFA
jgi:thiamine biosynthesis lipoprotein